MPAVQSVDLGSTHFMPEDYALTDQALCRLAHAGLGGAPEQPMQLPTAEAFIRLSEQKKDIPVERGGDDTKRISEIHPVTIPTIVLISQLLLA